MVKDALISEIPCSPDEQRLHSRRQRRVARIKFADVVNDASLVGERFMNRSRLI
jgi:hypothetical protein